MTIEEKKKSLHDFIEHQSRMSVGAYVSRDDINEVVKLSKNLLLAIEALEWITNWGDIHDAHSRKADKAIATICTDEN